jgi:hypothetical protein
VAASVAEVPQCPQNFIPAVFSPPQFAQTQIAIAS